MRLSIYGRDRSEWDALARWMKTYNLHTKEATTRNVWMIQIPRIYPMLFGKCVNNFSETLENIFMPLFETVVDPSSHPELAEVLPFISGIDSVDDESVWDVMLARRSSIT